MPERGRTQAERRARSERRLLDATAKVIAEQGTTAVSFAEIAKVAGCSHGLPGYLFGSKTDLLLALVNEALDRFRADVADPVVGEARGLDAVLGLLRAFLDTLDRPRPYTQAIYVMIGEAMGAPPELRAALNRHHQAVRDMLRDALVEGMERGELRRDIDPEAEAAVLFGLARGIGSQVLLDPEAIDVPAVTAAALAATRRALTAAGAGEGG